MYISLMNNHIAERPFTYLWAICLFSSVKHLFTSLQLFVRFSVFSFSFIEI